LHGSDEDLAAKTILLVDDDARNIFACLMTFCAAQVKRDLGEGRRSLVSGEGWIGIPLAAIC
jgi:hypothetical protein